MAIFLMVLSWSYIFCTCATEAAFSRYSHIDHIPNSRHESINHQSSLKVDLYQRGTNNLERSHEANQPLETQGISLMSPGNSEIPIWKLHPEQNYGIKFSTRQEGTNKLSLRKLDHEQPQNSHNPGNFLQDSVSDNIAVKRKSDLSRSRRKDISSQQKDYRMEEVTPVDNISSNLLGNISAFIPSRYKRDINDTQSSQYYDGMIDTLLTGLKEKLFETENEINIPNISETFFVLWMKINFNAWDGWFSGLDSLQRSSSSVLQKEINTLQAYTKLTLDDITFAYDHYELKFHNFGPKGRIEIRVQKIDISLNTKINILNDTSCELILQKAQVTKLQCPQLEISGLSPFNSVISNFTSWLTEKMSKRIRGVVTARLNLAIQKALQNFTCNKYRVQIFKQIMRN
ncbi:uncharacterized protein [Anabrus simplex]|uniref:uncharacterized protein n=1 Tax=Anabrus simplex TaxID=316456 RepID=UPI0035A2EE37